jgi:uncharacterized protein YlxW (UPF0749 family)
VVDIKAIKTRHTAGMDSRQSAHQDREDLLAEVERLQHDIADLQMLRDEHQMDVMHAFQEGGEEERRKVVAHLRERAVHGAGNTITVEDACTVLADLFERGDHRREEER